MATTTTASWFDRKSPKSKLLVAIAILLNVGFSCFLSATLLWSSSIRNDDVKNAGGAETDCLSPASWRVSCNSSTTPSSMTRRQQASSTLGNNIPGDNACTNVLSFPVHGCHLASYWPTLSLCQFQNLTLDTAKLSAKVRGGEPLQNVMGQEENAEYLRYENGAFTVARPPVMDWTPPLSNGVLPPTHYIETVLDALVTIDNTKKDLSSSCEEVWTGTTLFITRYEYVNLFHTMTDWWNAFFTAGASMPVNVVFLDAHPEGNLDPVWRQLFRGKIAFARHLPGRVCFDVIRLVPAGYNSPLQHQPSSSRGGGADKNGDSSSMDVAAMKCFVDHVLQSLGVDHVKRIPGRVVVIDRVPYVAHPRSDVSKAPRLISNLRDMAVSLKQLALPNIDKLTVEVVTLVADSMKQQVQSIREADVLVANHGAGLTHLLFLDDGATVIEFSPKIPLFSRLSQWKPTVQFEIGGMVNGDIPPDQWDRFVVPAVARALSMS
jgi:Glycosyltransferase 61